MIINRIVLIAGILAATFSIHAETVVSLLTCSPGRDIYELEGHTALRFQDKVNGMDMVVNWGVFDFNAPGFVFRFVKGETEYMAGTAPMESFKALYRNEGREIVEQHLRLTTEEVARLMRMIELNLLPENRTYRYKYLTDNCATRPLTLIEKASERTISTPSDSIATTSWRSEMRRYHRNYPWYQFGIDLALGSGLDKKISSRECAFAPVFLSQYLQDAGIADEPTVILPGQEWGNPAEPTPWYLTPMAVALIVLAITLYIGVKDIRHHNTTRWYVCVFFSLMSLAGCVITFLVFISEHEATSPNWLLLWLNPLCLFPAVAVWLKKLNRAVLCYQIVNFAFLTALLIIFATGIQHPNLAFFPWILSDMILAGTYIWINIKKNR